jgi:hypothetical protein
MSVMVPISDLTRTARLPRRAMNRHGLRYSITSASKMTTEDT